MTIWPFVVAAAGIGFGAGAVFIGWLFETKSHDIWRVTNTAGATYWITDPAEIDAALEVDGGMLAVQRLRVLA